MTDAETPKMKSCVRHKFRRMLQFKDLTFVSRACCVCGYIGVATKISMLTAIRDTAMSFKEHQAQWSQWSVIQLWSFDQHPYV